MVAHNTKQVVRTRLAASPTGYPHIGTVYQALFNYAFAKKNNGKFIVRTEDTDRNRLVEGSENVIFESLEWFGLGEDESSRKDGDYKPYRQSERIKIYHKHAEELIQNGHAFYSFFPKQDAGQKKVYTRKDDKSILYETEEKPPESIGEMIERGDWVIRLKVPKGQKITFRDEIRGEITFDTSEVTEQVLIKSDGFPTYHLAVVVDDHLMEISHILRAEEWLSSTPKHILLYQYFNWEIPPIFHTAILRNPDKSKLSKRHGHTNVIWFREEGFLPEAILNFLALLGWTHPEEKEIFSLNEFIKLFDLKDIRPVAPIFDLVKLRWMNQQYIQSSTDEDLKKRIKSYSLKAMQLADDKLDALIPLLKSRMEVLSDFDKLTGVFFDEFKNAEFDEDEKSLARETKSSFQEIENWQHEAIFKAIKKNMTSFNIRMSVFYKLLTGAERGLPLPETLEILGQIKTLKRLEEVINK